MQQERQARHGWSEQERQALFLAAEQAVQEHIPIKRVFEHFAMRTGRKANSVRNYYYTEQKRRQPSHKASFIPFEEQELERMLEAMVRGRAQGKSVRSIALELSGGDERGMLRFQNKYRSLMKRDPGRILKKEQELLHDVGQDTGRELTRQTQKDQQLHRFMRNIVRSGKHGVLLLTGLNGLLEGGSGGDRAADEALGELAALNRAFVQQDGMARISVLEEYVASLQKCLERIDKV